MEFPPHPSLSLKIKQVQLSLIAKVVTLIERLPLLITGVSGVAGYNAFLDLHRRYPGQIFGTRPVQTFRLNLPGVVAIDSSDEDGLDRFVREQGIKTILNTTGNCALKACELNPEMSWRINVASVITLAKVAARHGLRVVHLSSDLVFSGAGQGGYVETDTPDPVTVYGKTMAEGERVLLDQLSDLAILRISLPMGPSFNRHAGAIDWIDSRFRAGRPATLYFDEVRSATYVKDLTEACAWFIEHDANGLFHAGAIRPISLYQIGQKVNRVGGYDPELLKGCPRHEAGPMPPRAGNVSMDSSKLRSAMGYDPFASWPAEPELTPTGNRRWHFERSDGEFLGRSAIVQRLYQNPSQLCETYAER